MSDPDMDIIFQSLKDHKLNLCQKLTVIENPTENAAEINTIHKRISRIVELMHQINMMRGLLDQHLNG